VRIFNLSYFKGVVLKPLNGKIVTANVNKKYSIETDENGVAIFNFGQLAVGNYSICFYFNEDDEYKGYSHITDVEVVPIAPHNPPAPNPPDCGVYLSATGFNLLLLAMFCVLVVGFVKR
jgi:hypothetical protein